MKRIGIIGGGFAGSMTAVQVIEKAIAPCEIILINNKLSLCRGVAYNPYSNLHILNVAAGKMSAFPDKADHFLNWVMEREPYRQTDREIISHSFLPRKLYGDYLVDVWETSLLTARTKGIPIKVIDGAVLDIDSQKGRFLLEIDNGQKLEIDIGVIATGNDLPRNPSIQNLSFYQSAKYFRNPWDIASVQNTDPNLPVLIVGNGLTMVDTVIGLLEQGFKGKIISVSPNGFNILPHRHGGIKYTKLVEELPAQIVLRDLVNLVNRHVKLVRDYGVSAEPVIDSLRPHTQRLWRGFSQSEKDLFMRRLRHLWGVARHRIPVHIHDKLQQLRIEGTLVINAGRIIDLTDSANGVLVSYYDKKLQRIEELKVSRVINCTGPETDFLQSERSFLKRALEKGMVSQDFQKLGLRADVETFRVIDSKGNKDESLYTLGSTLRGVLWESTAVKEVREQAAKLGQVLSSTVKH